MKVTDSFNQAIKAYLDKRAKEDLLFAQKFANPKKSIDECCYYVVGEALKNSADFTTGIKACQIDDNAIFGMAVHYYDEDDIKVNKIPANVRASVSKLPEKPIELTEAEKKAAREEAIRKLTEEQYALLRKKPTKTKGEDTEVKQMSLF